MADTYQIGDVLLYWTERYTDRWVGVVVRLHSDGAPIVVWQHAINRSWRPARVIQPSDSLHNLGRMPELVEWDVE